MGPGILYDPVFLDHRAEYYHPERPERLPAAIKGLEEAGVWQRAEKIPVRVARVEELERAHEPSYIENTLRSLSGGSGYLDPDTFYSPGTRHAALCAAGGGIDLARAVHERSLEWGFSLPRPPGHHATRDCAMGFCVLNHIAIATAALLACNGASRLAIVDFDVHHGNGTQDIFWTDPRVLFISLHQWPHYPGSGRHDELGGAAGLGKTVNIPLPTSAEDGDYLAAMDALVMPLLHAFSPEHILVSAGFDGHRRDPLAGMNLSSELYGELGRMLRTAADQLCDGKLTAFFEGGYDLLAIEESMAMLATALDGRARLSNLPRVASPRARKVISAVESAIAPHWLDIAI